MQLKKKSLALLLSGIMAFSSVPAFAQETEIDYSYHYSDGVMPAPYKAVYEGTEEEIQEILAQEAIENTPVVSSFSLANSLSTKILSYAAEEELPEKYNTPDLAKVNVSAVKNQKSHDTCWAYASTAIYEGRIMAQNGDNADIDYSENHMRTALSDDNGNIYGFNRASNKGGTIYMGVAYYTRNILNGAVTEQEDPYDYDTISRSVTETVSHKADNTLLRRTIEIPNYLEGATKEEIDAKVEEIKRVVYENGATYLAYNHDESLYSENKSYYLGDASKVGSNHAVTIVGWNDNYSKENFRSDNRPEYDGAFVVKNSWGPEWGQNGFFHMSYYTKGGFQDVISFAEIGTRDKAEYIYEYDEFGKGRSSNPLSDSSTVCYANKFTKKTDFNETLNSVYTHNSSEFNYAKVYVSTTGDLSDLKEVEISNLGDKT